MFHDEAVFKVKSVKADLGAQKVVFHVDKDEVAVSKSTNGVQLRLFG